MTAHAIAQEVGIATSSKCHVITGTELRNMTPDLLDWTLCKYEEIGKYLIPEQNLCLKYLKNLAQNKCY